MPPYHLKTHGQCQQRIQAVPLSNSRTHLFAVMICQTQGNQLERNRGTGHFPGKWDNMSRIFQSFLRLEPIRTIAPE